MTVHGNLIEQLKQQIQSSLNTHIGKPTEATLVKHHVKKYLRQIAPGNDPEVMVTPHPDKPGVFQIDVQVPEWIAKRLEEEQ